MKSAFAVAFVATASADEGSPVGKVIEMISDLQAKVIKEGEATQATYEEFSTWCEERAGETQREITPAKNEVMNLKASIEKESATIQTSTGTIEELAGEIASAEADLAAATKIRKSENADFLTFEADTADTIDTIERAIGVIEKGLTGGASMMQFQNAGGVVQALAAMVRAESISGGDGKKLTALLQSDSDDDDTGAPAGAVFENSAGSGNILDSLNGLLEKANSQLEDSRATEKSSLQNFDMLAMSLKDQSKFANKELDEAKKAKAQAEEYKATAEGDLGVTTNDLNDDISTLASLHHDCMAKASEFEIEVTSRSEELKALATAKKIVIEATSLLQTSDSFLQLSSRADLVNFEAVRYVRDLAKKQHSNALTQLASRMDTTVRFGGSNREDVFAKIKAMVTDMIAKLEAEAAADATEKAFCDKEVPEAQAKVDDKADEIEKLTAKIDKMIAKATTLKNEVSAIQAQLVDLTKSQAEMDKIRLEEKGLFEAAKPELEQAVAGIQKALKVLNDYYAKDASHGSAGGSSTGIIGLLEVCESDFSKELAEITDSEAKSIYYYDQTTKENEITKVTKEQDVKFKTRAAAGLDKSVAEYSSDRAGVATESDAVKEQLKQLNARCTAKAESYSERKSRREEEMAGLNDAMTVLESQTALIQTRSKHFMSVYRH